MHLRPTVILRVDAHTVNGSRKHVPCCHTSAQKCSNLKYARNGRMKRVPQLPVDEVSVEILRENHETIQQFTSQFQQMQEQMNSMNDSGDFQDVESNYSGRFCHVSSQPAMIPSSRSLLSSDKGLPLDKWNQSGLQENVFGINFLRVIHPEIILREFNLTTCEETEK